jgi:hypothetical protein
MGGGQSSFQHLNILLAAPPLLHGGSLFSVSSYTIGACLCIACHGMVTSSVVGWLVFLFFFPLFHQPKAGLACGKGWMHSTDQVHTVRVLLCMEGLCRPGLTEVSFPAPVVATTAAVCVSLGLTA